MLDQLPESQLISTHSARPGGGRHRARGHAPWTPCGLAIPAGLREMPDAGEGIQGGGLVRGSRGGFALL